MRYALDELAKGTWRTSNASTFVEQLHRLRKVRDVLEEEYIADTWYARWRMTLWRRKRSVLMQSFSATLRASGVRRGDKVVYGVGACFRGKCGRGEQPVPTCSARNACHRTLKSQSTRYDALMVAVDECMTTAMCHRCHCRLDDVEDEFGLTVRGTKHCPHCVGPSRHAGVFRNRDKNAALNILAVLKAVVGGQERPTYLCKPQASSRDRKPPAKNKRVKLSSHT